MALTFYINRVGLDTPRGSEEDPRVLPSDQISRVRVVCEADDSVYEINLPPDTPQDRDTFLELVGRQLAEKVAQNFGGPVPIKIVDPPTFAGGSG